MNPKHDNLRGIFQQKGCHQPLALNLGGKHNPEHGGDLKFLCGFEIRSMRNVALFNIRGGKAK